MQVSLQEKLCLCAGFRDDEAMRSLATELPTTRFNYGPGNSLGVGHRLIYEAMLKVFGRDEDVNVASVAKELGHNLNHVGGEAYLFEITETIGTLNIESLKGLPQWAEVVDSAGQLFMLRKSLNDYAATLEDVPRALTLVKNPSAYIMDLMEELGHIHKAKTDYEHIRTAAASFRESFDREATGQAVSWLPIGWESTKKYKILPYDSLVVITGLSSIGKSQLMAQFILGAAINLKISNIPGVCLINTYEMPNKLYVQRMATSLSGVDINSESALTLGSPEYNRLMEASEFIEDLPIYSSDADMTTSDIAIQANSMVAQHKNVHIVGVDYSELVPDDTGNSEEQRVANVYRNCKRLAQSLGPSVMVLSQVTGEAFTSSTKIAGAWGTRYTKVGWHAADLEIEIYNPVQMQLMSMTFELPPHLPDRDHAYLLIQKNKNGPLGFVQLEWTPEYTRFSDPAMLRFGGKQGLYRNLDQLWADFKAKGNEDF